MWILKDNFTEICGKPTPLGVGWIAKYFIINRVYKC